MAATSNSTEHISSTMDPYSDHERLTMISIICLCIIITLIGNSIMIWSIAKIPSLRTINNIFLASLCCANLLNGVYTMPLIAHAMVTDKVSIQSWNCAISGLIDNAAMVGFMWTLTVLSLDRYCLITFPIFYKCKQSQSVALITLTTVWLFSFLSVTPPLFSVAPYRYSPYTFSCGMDPTWDNKDMTLKPGSFYFMVFSIFNSALPIPIILFSHVFILKVLLKTRNIRHEVTIKRYKRSALLMMALTLYLLISMSPVFIGSYMFIYCILSSVECTAYVPPKCIMVAHILFLANGAVTPIFFGLFNSSIRTKYLLFIHSRKQSIISNIANKYPAGLATSLKRQFSLTKQEDPVNVRVCQAVEQLARVNEDKSTYHVNGGMTTFEDSQPQNSVKVTYDAQNYTLNKVTYDAQNYALSLTPNKVGCVDSWTDTPQPEGSSSTEEGAGEEGAGEEGAVEEAKVCNVEGESENDLLLEIDQALETAV